MTKPMARSVVAAPEEEDEADQSPKKTVNAHRARGRRSMLNHEAGWICCDTADALPALHCIIRLGMQHGLCQRMTGTRPRLRRPLRLRRRAECRHTVHVLLTRG